VAVAAIAGSTVTINSTLETTAYAGGTVTADPADATNPRRDLVYYDQTGAVDIATGTATAVTSTTGPALPILTADQIAVAELYVDANAVTIEAGDITDRRQSDSPAPDTGTISSTAQEFVEGGAYKGFWGSGPASGGAHTYVTGDLVGLGCQLLQTATSAMTADADAGDAVTWLHSTGTTSDSDTGLVGPRLAAANDWTMVWRGTLTTGAAIRCECIGAASVPYFVFDTTSGVIGFRVITTGEIVGVVDNSGTETTRASGVTPDGATEHTLRIEVREAGTIVRFYLDNAQVGADVTTNIPTGVLYALCGLRNNTTSSVTMNTADWFGWREI
jgi:hypothetical protein